MNTISEVFYLAEVLAKQPRPRGPRLAIVTNAGGPGVLAVDALIRSGGELAELSAETLDKLNAFLPAPWSHGNPVDILGDADPARYAKALEAVAADPKNDGILVVLTPQAMSDPTGTAEKIRAFAKVEGKPVLASWMGGNVVATGEAIMNQAGIPTFPYPDTAARVFQSMWRSTYNLRGLYETPTLPVEDGDLRAGREAAAALVDQVRGKGRTVLTEFESKELLEAYKIPTVPTKVAVSPECAVDAATVIGFPVVLKLHSETITHKTDVGGVKLGLADADSVRQAYQAIETSVTEKAGAWPFPRCDGAADGCPRSRRLRADRRHHARPAIRAGLALWNGGSARGSLPRPRPGPSTTEHDPGPPDDGADQDLPGPQGRARPQAGRFVGAGAASRSVQPVGGRAALDS